MGVYLEMGSRHETDDTQGASHFIERMAFKSTKHRTGFRVVRDLSRLGCNSRTSVTRENVAFVADGLRSSTAAFTEILADMVRNPEFAAIDVETVQTYLSGLPVDGQAAMDEAIHYAAFGGETLGRPLAVTAKSAHHITPELLQQYHAAQVTPHRLVVTGAGVTHDELVALADKFFGDMAGAPAPAKVAAVYKGGAKSFDFEHDDGLNHVYLGWQAPSWTGKDLAVARLINLMLGGRNQLYSDAGLLGLHLQAAPAKTAEAVDAAAAAARKLTSAPSSAALQQAKLQLQTAIHFNLEARASQVEDIGAQVAATGAHQSAAALAAHVDKVTAADVARVATAMFKQPVTYVVSGDKLAQAPSLDQVVKKFL